VPVRALLEAERAPPGVNHRFACGTPELGDQGIRQTYPVIDQVSSAVRVLVNQIAKGTVRLALPGAILREQLAPRHGH